jgi:hypothetical protein
MYALLLYSFSFAVPALYIIFLLGDHRKKEWNCPGGMLTGVGNEIEDGDNLPNN